HARKQIVDLAQFEEAAKRDGLMVVQHLDLVKKRLENEEDIKHQEELNRIALDRLEREQKILLSSQTDELDAKVKAQVQYANTDHLVRMSKTRELIQMYKEVDAVSQDSSLSDATKKRTKDRLETTIRQLEAELDGLERT